MSWEGLKGSFHGLLVADCCWDVEILATRELERPDAVANGLFGFGLGVQGARLGHVIEAEELTQLRDTSNIVI